MFTLLPEESNKQLRKEYKLRLFVIFVLLIAVSVVIAIVLFLPSYVSSKVKLKDFQAEKVELQQSPELQKGATLSALLSGAKAEVMVLSTADHSVVKLIELINAHKNSAIKIQGISYSFGAPSTLELRGVAFTRDYLTNFVKDLRTLPNFTAVTYPLADLVAEKYGTFTITITGTF